MWDAQLKVDLRAAWLCARAAAPHMRRLRGGRIINIGDWLARSGRPRYTGYLTYYVAKAGVMALTEALALELATDQILVNAIAPGPIVAPEDTSDETFAAVERATPLGRWGGEIEIAKMVLALVDSDFVTGETIRVDGGRHLEVISASHFSENRRECGPCVLHRQIADAEVTSRRASAWLAKRSRADVDGAQAWSRIPGRVPRSERA